MKTHAAGKLSVSGSRIMPIESRLPGICQAFPKRAATIALGVGMDPLFLPANPDGLASQVESDLKVAIDQGASACNSSADLVLLLTFRAHGLRSPSGHSEDSRD